MSQAVKKAKVVAFAMPMDASKAPGLFEMLRDLGKSSGCAVPDNVVLEMGTGFYVTEAEVVTFSASLHGRTLCLSAPLARVLKPEELRAIVAHEFAHFTGDDTLFSRRFYPVYRGTSQALADFAGMANSGGERGPGVMILPMILPAFVISRYLGAFSQVEARISRARESRADAHAAAATSATIMASALQKVYAAGPLWHEFVPGAMVQLLNDGGRAFINASTAFVDHLRGEDELISEVLADAANIPSHPTDSHPTLKDRLRALGVEGNGASLEESTNSASLFADLESLERHLTDLVTSYVAQTPPNVNRRALSDASSAAESATPAST